MNLLLLLSALLSALTGVATSARVPEARQAVASSTTARARVAERQVPTVRPPATLATLPSLANVFGLVPLALPLPLPGGEPLWASRRRE